jgi:hypothetical protein
MGEPSSILLLVGHLPPGVVCGGRVKGLAIERLGHADDLARDRHAHHPQRVGGEAPDGVRNLAATETAETQHPAIAYAREAVFDALRHTRNPIAPELQLRNDVSSRNPFDVAARHGARFVRQERFHAP